MPELPEVETVRRGLEPRLVGRTLHRVEILDERLVMPYPPREIEARLQGQTVEAVERRGKYLVLRLGSDLAAMHHLRMTGSFAVAEPGAADPVSHVRARYFTTEATVCYRDPRRFGTLMVDEWPTVSAYLDARLGPEPLGPGFSSATLYAGLHQRVAPVKAVLLDQRVVAGLGNIYVDEALFQARVNPLTPASAVSRAAAARLHAAIVDRLEVAIAAGGSTLRDYRAVEGTSGSMQEQFLAYGHAGEPCSRCGRALRGGRVAGRGTTWCAHCQPLRVPRRA